MNQRPRPAATAMPTTAARAPTGSRSAKERNELRARVTRIPTCLGTLSLSSRACSVEANSARACAAASRACNRVRRSGDTVIAAPEASRLAEARAPNWVVVSDATPEVLRPTESAAAVICPHPLQCVQIGTDALNRLQRCGTPSEADNPDDNQDSDQKDEHAGDYECRCPTRYNE